MESTTPPKSYWLKVELSAHDENNEWVRLELTTSDGVSQQRAERVDMLFERVQTPVDNILRTFCNKLAVTLREQRKHQR